MTDPDEAVPAAYSIRTHLEDFKVFEESLYTPSGHGKHTFVHIEKRNRTTEQVARELARVAGFSPRDVGYAGRKDRHAVTRQWFSLPEMEPEKVLDFELEEASVLEAARHEHKLKTGHLRANRFEIILRGEVEGETIETVRSRAALLVRHGMKNAYGMQRFGRDGDNAGRAREMLVSGRAPRDRRAGRFLLSALQSEVFNAVLAARADSYDDVIPGDLARVEESGGLFWVEDLERERPRAAAFEISATGPIFGTKVRAPREAAAELEGRVFERFGIPGPRQLRLPRGIRARGTRRPLRVRPADLQISDLDEGRGLRISCSLPSGSYVTVLLEALVGPTIDASREKGSSDGGNRRDVS